MPGLGLGFVGLGLMKTSSPALVEGLGWAQAGLGLEPRLQTARHSKLQLVGLGMKQNDARVMGWQQLWPKLSLVTMPGWISTASQGGACP